MRVTFQSPLALLLLTTACLPTVFAGYMGNLVFGACQLAFGFTIFTEEDAAALKTSPKLRNKCENRLQIESLYLCLKIHGQGSDAWNEPLSRENETCQTYLDTPLPPFSIVDHYTDEDIENLRHMTFEERSVGSTFSEIIVPSQRVYDAAYNTLDAVDYVYYYHYGYSFAVIVFWAVVVCIGLSSRLAWAVALSQRRSIHSEKPLGLFDRFSVWLKRYITIPATFGYRCSQNMWWCTIPPRVQSITLLVFIALNTLFCMHGYMFTKDNLYFPTTEKQFWRYISDRTGFISFANFPVIWLFGMRNNVLAWVTGWDFGMYNNFHRWVARVSTLQAVIHSVGYTILILIEVGLDNYWKWYNQLFWTAGVLATVFMCLLLGFSVYWMRRKHYELFLVLHIVISILVLITMVLHLSIFKKTRYDMLCWIPGGIWILDRIIRMTRTLSFNLKFWDTWATATYEPSSNMVRLSVPQSTSWYEPAPGTFYYIHVLSDPRFWESHPFTMAYSTGHRRRRSKDSTEDTPLMQEEDAISLARDPTEPPSMKFLIRPYDSFTSRLKDTAAAPWPTPASLRVLVEGPYGHTQPFADFEHVLFIVGGSGIAVPLAYLHTLVSSPRTRSIRVVWAAREIGLAEDVLNDDIGDLIDSNKLSLKINITHQETPGDSSLSSFPKSVDVKYHRPDVTAEIEAATRSAGTQSLAVVACGPARMADDARRAVVNQLGEKAPRIEYFEESFKW